MAGGRRSKRTITSRDSTQPHLPRLLEDAKTAASLLVAAASQPPAPAPSWSASSESASFASSQLPPYRLFGDGEDHAGPVEEDDERYLVGFVEVNVVGLQYYRGTVNNREMVRLIREPFNAYDRNAIRVENMQGEQVGHVERYKACYLAPLMDDESALLEGIVPRGSRNTYRMPCQVFVFSKHTDMTMVLNTLLRSGLTVVTPNDPDFEELSAMASSENTKSASEKFEKSIDDIFDSLILNQGKATPAMDPSAIITTKLYPHQREALAWLVGRENSIELPPFWKEQEEKKGGKLFYVNTLTNFMTEQKPEPFQGGIFADEMGLGKTLSLVSLIATNKPGVLFSHVENLQSGESTSTRPLKRKRIGEVETKVLDSKVSQSTLVVCPLSVMSIWVSQLEEHTVAGSLKVYLYHGPDRTNKANSLSSYDIVLTTYSILASEGTDAKSPLQKINWLRVILDEAHLIKNPNARMTQAAVALKAERRWAVTGTPIQNGARDLYSLMMFLKLKPLDDKSFWNRTIQRPLLAGDASGFMRLQALLMTIAIRRTKDMKVNDKRIVDLPRRTVVIHNVELTPEDRKLYDRMELEGKRLVGHFLESGTVLQNYSTILQIILRLRQICDHSCLCPLKEGFLDDTVSSFGDLSSSPELLQKLLSILQSGEDFDCPICLSPPSSAVITKCAHVFCRKCIERTLTQDKERCPMCRVPLEMSDLFASPEVEPTGSQGLDGAQQKTSSKIKTLLQLLMDLRVNDPTAKSVVFSQFSGMLNLVQDALEAADFKYVRLDGSMSLKKREAALKAFQSQDQSSPSVFLLSLKAAGVGLNLVSACRVFMLDPWWNPAVEEQAMERVHRLGQTRDVEIVRLIVQDSIEERILEMQEKKRSLASHAFKKSADEIRRSRIADLQHLMQL